MRLLILLTCLVFFLPGSAVYPNDAAKHLKEDACSVVNISGSIFDIETGEKLVCAKIEIEETGISLFSDIRGYYLVSELKPGTHNIRVSYISYH